MLPNVAIKAVQVRRNGIAAISLRLFAVVMFVGLFTVLSTSADAESSYSDSWVESNPNTTSIVGCGVTRAEYYEDYHMVSVQTTITSPNGRSDTDYGGAYGAQYKRPYIARAEPLLTYSLNDVGNYIVDSHHFSDCPQTDFGTTSTLLPISLKKSAYRVIDDTATTCGYGRTCIGPCAEGAFSGDKAHPGPCPGPYVQCLTLYAGGICWHDTRLCTEQSTPGECDS